MFGISGVYLDDRDTKEYIMVGLGNRGKQSPISAVGLSCLHHLATIVMVCRSSKGSYLKIILLFFVGMFSVDFIPTLGEAMLPALIIDPRSFFSVSGEKYSTGSCSRANYRFVCYALYML